MVNKNGINGLLLKTKIKVILAIVGIIICVVVICGISIAVYKEYDSYISLKNVETLGATNILQHRRI